MEKNINVNCNKNNITMEFFNNESSQKEEQKRENSKNKIKTEKL